MNLVITWQSIRGHALDFFLSEDMIYDWAVLCVCCVGMQCAPSRDKSAYDKQDPQSQILGIVNASKRMGANARYLSHRLAVIHAAFRH